MGQLPADRVTPAHPFSITGVDFAGSITTLVNRDRGRKTNKSYILLFVCFATKAVHLEAVRDLSAASFIAALRRFAGRRDCPQRIYCDNATILSGQKMSFARYIICSRRQDKKWRSFVFRTTLSGNLFLRHRLT